jgi:hypothetical protein
MRDFIRKRGRVRQPNAVSRKGKRGVTPSRVRAALVRVLGAFAAPVAKAMRS